jgi:cytochrome c oxidase subunit 4
MTEKMPADETLSNRTYIIVWICLLGLTTITVAVAKLHLMKYAIIPAIAIATVKAGLVVNFFMHLKEEPWVLKIMLFVALFALTLIILLTFVDTWYRYGLG